MGHHQLSAGALIDIAKRLVAEDKVLLAMDESIATCNERFAKLGIPQTKEARHAYRELLITTPGLGEAIGGVILLDETIHHCKADGTSFISVLTEADIVPGIKVDIGAKALAFHPVAWQLIVRMRRFGIDLALNRENDGCWILKLAASVNRLSSWALGWSGSLRRL